MYLLVDFAFIWNMEERQRLILLYGYAVTTYAAKNVRKPNNFKLTYRTT